MPRAGNDVPSMAAAAYAPVLATRGVSRRFGATRALSDVDFASFAGEVHAIVGQNGAGKSTLMNLFAGVFPPSEGEILLDGQSVRFGHPLEARRAGIRTVYQVPDLIPHLNVAENLYLGEEPGRLPGLLSPKALYQQAEELVSRLELELPLRQPVSSLSVSQQQLVTVARALASPLRVLILDEPTAALGPREADYLFDLVSKLKQDGGAILYISHRLEEIMNIADRVTVLRDGKVVGTGMASETSRSQMVAQMTGGKAVGVGGKVAREVPPGPEVLRVEGLWAQGLGPFDISVAAGEILGLGGLVGSGRSELLRLIFGADRPLTGNVIVGGTALQPGDPLSAVAAGVGFVTEERLHDGLAASLPVSTNLTMTRLQELRQERSIAETIITKLGIRGTARQPVGELSGGNQQKVALGKWLKDGIRVLLIDEPTQGVDVGAKEEIHTLMRELADQGVAIVLVSSEFSELVALSDRVLVMRDGVVVKELVGEEVSEVGLLGAAVS